MEYFKIAELADIPENGCKVVILMRKEIALFRWQNRIYAIDNLCPHRGAPLSAGQVTDGVVSCPWHGARFELATGKGLKGSHQSDIGSYQVKIEGSIIKIGLEV